MLTFPLSIKTKKPRKFCRIFGASNNKLLKNKLGNIGNPIFSSCFYLTFDALKYCIKYRKQIVSKSNFEALK